MEISTTFILNIVINMVLGIVVAYISWSLKELYANMKKDKEEMKENLNTTNQNVKDVSKDLESYKISVPKDYVLKEEFNRETTRLKEDFTREINKLDMKLDNVRQDIGELNKNVSSLIAVVQRGVKQE